MIAVAFRDERGSLAAKFVRPVIRHQSILRFYLRAHLTGNKIRFHRERRMYCLSVVTISRFRTQGGHAACQKFGKRRLSCPRAVDTARSTAPPQLSRRVFRDVSAE